MGRFLVTAFLLTCVFIYKAQVKDGLVARYTFNAGNTKDEQGHNPAKAYNTSLEEDRFDNSNKACYFHGGPESYLDLGTSNLLKPQKGTISLWINSHGIMGLGIGVETNPFIATRSHGGEDCNQAYYIGFDLNTRKVNGSSAISYLEGTTLYSRKKINLNQWYHVVFTFDDTLIKLYLDGEIQYQLKKNFKNRYLLNAPVIVGNLKGKKNSRFFLGCIDDIMIFNRPLADNEVLELYNEPNPEKYNHYLKWFGYALGIFAVIFVIIWAIHQRVNNLLKKEKEKNSLQNSWYEQENRVKTAQMNPHFIFNSLNAIQQFIIVNENDKAQLYLSKFSKLIRKILDNNTQKSISLKDEIDVFEKYLEIESLRFNDAFDYKIEIDKTIDPAKINIPHFLIQPIIENAIWHGLLPKEGFKHLNVLFEPLDSETLRCTIDDNGVGRIQKNSAEGFEKQKSLAVSFIKQRLKLMSKLKKKAYGIIVVDKVDEYGKSKGTKVIMTLPVLMNN